MRREETQQPQVVLVGAGPGEPGLLTREGADWLARADVVVYDRLVHPDTLALARPDARLVYVGKASGAHSRSQEEINQLLLDAARDGALVVRLKGGDPLIFGRGGEEAQALTAAGVPLRIVPGVTAALAAGACAGIPLTHRGLASSVTFVTGHEDPAKDASALDWAALARGETLVFYMGVGNLPQIARELIAHGRDGTTPAAVVEQAARPAQRTVRAPLAELAEAAGRAGVRPPALVIVGPVAALADELGWYERLPLHGQRVAVTRDARSEDRLRRRLEQAGAEVLAAPAIEIQSAPDPAAADEALRRAATFDWVVFTSANGVRAFADRCERLGRDVRVLGTARLAAVGPGTADALGALHLRADLLPSPYTTAALADALLTAGAGGRRVLLLRSDLATPELPERLRAGGATVEDVAIYRTARPAALPDEALAALRQGQVDWITFTSASTVENFLALAAGVDLGRCRLAAIGPVTADALRRCGLAPAVVAEPHTLEALADAIAAFETAPPTEEAGRGERR